MMNRLVFATMLVAAEVAGAWELNPGLVPAPPPLPYQPNPIPEFQGVAPNVGYLISSSRIKAQKAVRAGGKTNYGSGVTVDHGLVVGPGATVNGDVIIIDELGRRP